MSDDEKQGMVERAIYAAWDMIDSEKIMEQVDRTSLDDFVKDCVNAATTSGAVPGVAFFVGGPFASLGAAGADLVNVLYQQQRITIAVVYSFTERTPDLPELLQIIGKEMGLTVGGVARSGTAGVAAHSLVTAVARGMAIRLFSTAPLRAVPLAGSLIGMGVNRTYLKRYARELKAHAPRLLGLTE